MSNILLKFKANLPKNQSDTFSKLYKLLVSDSAESSLNSFAIHKIETIRSFKQVLSISEDDDSYTFYAKSDNGFLLIPILKEFSNSTITSSNWHKATDLILKHCMGITPNITETLLDDFKTQLKIIERSTNDMSELFYKYDKAMANIKIQISPSTLLHATRPREILEDISSNVKREAFNIVRQQMLSRTVDRCNMNL